MTKANEKSSATTRNAEIPFNKDRAVIYARVSVAGPNGKDSLAVQEKTCRDFCAKKGWDVVQVFEERGASTEATKRRELQRMLAYCMNKKNLVKYAVVLDLGRLCRQSSDSFIVKAMLKNAGVTLNSVTEGSDESPTGKLVETVITVFAQFDREMRSRSRSSLRR